MARWTTILSPTASVATGIGIGVVDVFLFERHLPPTADVRTATPHNDDVDASRRQATALCIAVNGLVSLMTRDWNVFLIGGIITVGLNVTAVHANALNPQTGKMDGGTPSINPEQNMYSLPDYSDDMSEAG